MSSQVTSLAPLNILLVICSNFHCYPTKHSTSSWIHHLVTVSNLSSPSCAAKLLSPHHIIMLCSVYFKEPSRSRTGSSYQKTELPESFQGTILIINLLLSPTSLVGSLCSAWSHHLPHLRMERVLVLQNNSKICISCYVYFWGGN